MNEITNFRNRKEYSRISVGRSPSRSVSYPYVPTSKIVEHLKQCLDTVTEYSYSPMQKALSTSVLISKIELATGKQTSEAMTVYHETQEEVFNLVCSAMAGLMEESEQKAPEEKPYVPQIPEVVTEEPAFSLDLAGFDFGVQGLGELTKTTTRAYFLEYETEDDGEDITFRYRATSQQQGLAKLVYSGEVVNIISLLNGRKEDLMGIFKDQLIAFYGGSNVFESETPIEVKRK